MSKRVLFILPSTGHVELKRGYPPNISIAYFSSILKSNGHQVALFDAEFSPVTELKKLLISFNPDIVALSGGTAYIKNAHKYAKIVKDVNKNIITVIGGWHVSGLPEDTMREFSCFDVGVIGEAEITLLNLMHYIDQNKIMDDIPGIAFRKNEKIIITDPPEIIMDLDSLPYPDWSIFDLKNYKSFFKSNKPQFMILISKGCKYNCEFCISPDTVFRKRSPDSIIEEIKFMKKRYDVSDYLFGSDTITTSESYIAEICEKITHLEFKINWWAGTRIDKIDKSLSELMKKAGCRLLVFGIDAGNETVNESMNKSLKINRNDTIRIIKEVRECGISVHVTVMLGYPNETENSLQETLKYLSVIKPNHLFLPIFTPYPGTLIYKKLLDSHKYRIMSFDWDLYIPEHNHYLIENPDVSEKQLLDTRRYAYIKFYSNPANLLNILYFFGIYRIFNYFFNTVIFDNIKLIFRRWVPKFGEDVSSESD
jgi:anaerobic magnesium-protoporphyrin IX monomethyl ester cyclase